MLEVLDSMVLHLPVAPDFLLQDELRPQEMDTEWACNIMQYHAISYDIMQYLFFAPVDPRCVEQLAG